MPRYQIERVDIRRRRVRHSTWSFAGKSTRGDEYTYIVTDQNRPSRNRWEFIVRVPDAPDGRVEVRPVRVPNDKAYASLDRRSITFSRATAKRYLGTRFCEVSLAVPGGSYTRRIVHIGEKKRLPYWFKGFTSRFRKKVTVRGTARKDGSFLVAVVGASNHPAMIRLFLATKAWVLKSGFSLPH